MGITTQKDWSVVYLHTTQFPVKCLFDVHKICYENVPIETAETNKLCKETDRIDCITLHGQSDVVSLVAVLPT